MGKTPLRCLGLRWIDDIQAARAMDTHQALLIFPHQLFEPHPGLEPAPSRIVLIEDSLFFGDRHHPASFHVQKLWLHRTP